MSDVEYFDEARARQDLSHGVALMSDDPNLFELEPKPFLERIENEILGNVEDDAGRWVRDPSKERIMNELGASTFKHEVSCRFSTHTNFSELSIQDIKEQVTWALDAFADNLEDNWQKWEVNPTYGNLMSICERLYSILYIDLLIAKNAGMRKHRERSKNPYSSIMQQQQVEPMV